MPGPNAVSNVHKVNELPAREWEHASIYSTTLTPFGLSPCGSQEMH